jgi:hypothetical protein
MRKRKLVSVLQKVFHEAFARAAVVPILTMMPGISRRIRLPPRGQRDGPRKRPDDRVPPNSPSALAASAPQLMM